MQDYNPKHSHMTIPEIQKQLYAFLTSKNKPYANLPQFIRQNSPLKVIITTKYVLPMLSQVQLETKRKQMIIRHLIDIITNSQDTVRQIEQFFNNNTQTSLQQLTTQIKGQITLLNSLSRLISLPSILTNMIGDPKVSLLTFSARDVQKCKANLYFSILQASNKLLFEERLIIVNKLLVLKDQEIVVQLYLKKDIDFLINNFDLLSKQNNIIKCIYLKMFKQTQEQNITLLKKVLKQLANKSSKISSCVISLLNLNELQYYSDEKYKTFYEIFYDTKLKQQITKDLLLWWAVSKNFIVTKTHAKVRCNILAMIIDRMTKQQLYESDYLVSITEGIKKRLADGQSKQFAMLIWKMLGKKLELKLTEDINKTDYFDIKVEKTEHIVQTRNEKSNIQQIKIKISQKNNKEPIKSSQQKLKCQIKSDQQEQRQDQTTQIIKIQPKNIYDCILGLRNPHRKDIALKKLPTIIKKYKDDLVLMWNSLLRQLLSSLKEQYIPILTQLFVLRPEQFIDCVVQFFINRQNNIGQRVHLIQILKNGIQELSTIQNQEEQQQDQGFYFKKVTSKYFKDSQQTKISEKQRQKKEQRTRRWGHTRIAYENSIKGNVSLNFLKKQTSINSFYPVANLVYFKVIDVMTLNLIQNLRSHQVYVHILLKLLAIFVSNISNHFDKYIIVSDVSSHCAKIVLELIQNSKRKNDRYQQTGGLTLMLTLQVLNKIALIIDHYVTDAIMDSIKQSIQNGRKLPNYGMSSVLDMIESNIYQKVYMKRQ